MIFDGRDAVAGCSSDAEQPLAQLPQTPARVRVRRTTFQWAVGDTHILADTDFTKIVLIGALLILLVGPAAAALSAADITVTTPSDATNGDVRSVAALIASPGPDGISLREAIYATNNDPGVYTIRFAPALAGATILVGATPLPPALPPLTGGGVTIEGDIDGNGSPDVTLRPTRELMETCCVHSGLQIASSGNRLHALAIEGFHTGVELEPAKLPPDPLPTHKTFADNVVSGVVIRGVHNGVLLGSVPSCGTEKPPCPTYNRWTNTTITGNRIESPVGGIGVGNNLSIGDRVEGLSVTENTIRQNQRDPSEGGAAIGVGVGLFATQNVISDVLIARNEIDAVHVGGDGGIEVGSGLQRAQANTIERVRILDNRIRVVRHRFGPCCFGIIVGAGWDTFAVDLRPITYPDRNVLRNVQISGNSISGSLAEGVRIMAGHNGGSSNRVEDVRVQRNVIGTTTSWGKGVALRAGGNGPLGSPVRPVRPATANRITGVTISANRITNGKSKSPPVELPKEGGGIVLVGGNNYARRGVIRDVRITRNRIAAARFGIMLIGGLGSTARGNRVSCVRLAGNRITGSRKRVRVLPNSVGASGNRASLGGC